MLTKTKKNYCSDENAKNISSPKTMTEDEKIDALITYFTRFNQIIIPKSIMQMKIHDKSCLLISETLTDNLFLGSNEIKKIIRDYAEDDEYLLLYSGNDIKTAKRMKSDLLKVVDKWDSLFSNIFTNKEMSKNE